MTDYFQQTKKQDSDSQTQKDSQKSQFVAPKNKVGPINKQPTDRHVNTMTEKGEDVELMQ